MLDLKIGSRGIFFNFDIKVIESGTGSGSFSHSLIKSIAPKGHLYTFEYHKERYLMAQEEFKQHKLQDYVTVYHRNVCKEGFTLQVADIDAGKNFFFISSIFRFTKSLGGFTTFKRKF
jgi:tRNA (adenine57-N1/adenine58-N1)-methyltransferase